MKEPGNINKDIQATNVTNKDEKSEKDEDKVKKDKKWIDKAHYMAAVFAIPIIGLGETIANDMIPRVMDHLFQ
jgi:hypothetical protein